MLYFSIKKKSKIEAFQFYAFYKLLFRWLSRKLESRSHFFVVKTTFQNSLCMHSRVMSLGTKTQAPPSIKTSARFSNHQYFRLLKKKHKMSWLHCLVMPLNTWSHREAYNLYILWTVQTTDFCQCSYREREAYQLLPLHLWFCKAKKQGEFHGWRSMLYIAWFLSYQIEFYIFQLF